MRIFLFLVSLIISLSLNAQQQTISGKIFSLTHKTPLAYSTVSLVNNKDSSILFVTTSDTTGRFSIPVFTIGNLSISISYTGYIPIWKDIFINKGQSLSLDTLFLREISLMDSIVITAKRPPVEFNNDTIQFNTENFKTPPNAVVEDMLKRMPGFTVDNDGTVRFNGKIQRKLTVNGKDFFTGNPKIATQNLNADWIDKVQVYERKSDKAQFTGMDDGQTESTINLVLKKDKLKAIFGRASVAGGNNERFDAQTTINQFNKDKQRSFIGMSNNVNKQGFALSDMLTFNQSSMQSSGLINAGDFGLPIADMGLQQQGVANTYAGGLNINESWKKKTDLNASLQMSNIQLLTEKNTLRNNLFPGNNFTYEAETQNEKSTKQQRFNATIDHKFDSFHSVRITPQITLQQELNESQNNFTTYSTDNLSLNNGFTERTINTNRMSFNNNILLRKRFRKKGRTLSSIIIFGYNDDRSTGELLTENRFYTFGIPSRDSLFNQMNNSSFQSSQFNSSLTFTEQVGKRTLMELTGYYNTSHGSSDRQTLDFNNQSRKFDIPNTILSNVFNIKQDASGSTLRFRSNFKKINTGIAATVQKSILNSGNKTFQNSISQSFTDILPTVNMSYTINTKTNISINYSTNTLIPSNTQLQPVADISDPLNIYKGNPDLKRSYMQSITANLTNINLSRARNIFLMTSINKTNNAIVQSDIIDENGRRITTPVNTDDVINAFANMNAGLGIRKLKSNLSVGFGINHNETFTFINGLKNKLTNQSISPSLNWNFTLEKKLLIYMSARWNVNKASYSLQPSLNNRFLQQAYTVEMTNYFPTNIFLKNNLTYTINSGRASGFNTKIPYWTASISKSFLKNNRGELKLTALDVLNKNIGVNRIANQQFVEDTRYNVLKRYFMLSLLYILNKSGKNTNASIFIAN